MFDKDNHVHDPLSEAPELLDMELRPCPRCGAEARFERLPIATHWRASIICSNVICRKRLSGDDYGNTGRLIKDRESYEGEDLAFRRLAERWNAQGINDD